MENRQPRTMRILLTLMVSSFIAFNNTSLSSWGIVIIAALMLIVCFFQGGAKIEICLTKFHSKTFWFAIFCAISALWAANSKPPITVCITILEILLCMSMVFFVYQRKTSIEDFLWAIMWSGPVISIYTIGYYGVNDFVRMMSDSIRFENTFANSNALGMWVAMSIVIFIYKIINEKWKWIYVTMTFPIIILAMSQSRTALIECVFGIIIVLYFYFKRNEGKVNKLIKIVIITAIVIMALNYIVRLPIFGGMMERMTGLRNLFFGEGFVDSSALVRERMIEVGWKAFLEHPLLGLGIGNTYDIAYQATGHATYLHNNFIELLAATGLIGFILFYSFYIDLIIGIVRCVKKRILHSEMCLVLVLMMLLSDYGTVSYYIKGTYFLFMMCYLFLFQENNKQWMRCD